MFQKIRIFFRYTFAWILVIGCVALIGLFLYPLFTEKYSSMALPSRTRYIGGYNIKRWYPLEITRNTETISGEIQIPIENTAKLDSLEEIAVQSVGKKADNFFTTFKEAFSTNTNKQTVIYSKDETGVYRAQ